MSGLSLFDRLWSRLRERLVRTVTVSDGDHRYRFRCESVVDVWRAKTLREKEPGTVEWIRGDVKPGDVFYDIGANVGLYTLMAGRRVQPGGAVYAFEPHMSNVRALLHNVRLNGLDGAVRVLSTALHDREGYFDFNYHDAGSGSALSQLDGTRDDENREFRPVFTELKHATTVDRLVRDGVVRPADHVKLDVDGNELLVLRGMQELLGGPRPPRSLQVELGARGRDELLAFLRERNYEVAKRTFSSIGQRKIAAGADPESVTHNVLFRRGDSGH